MDDEHLSAVSGGGLFDNDDDLAIPPWMNGGTHYGFDPENATLGDDDWATGFLSPSTGEVSAYNPSLDTTPRGDAQANQGSDWGWIADGHDRDGNGVPDWMDDYAATH